MIRSRHNNIIIFSKWFATNVIVKHLLQVKWYRDTMLLDPNEFRLMEQFGIRHTLVLRKVAEEDFGNYSCSAENHLGKSRAFIEVSGKKA